MPIRTLFLLLFLLISMTLCFGQHQTEVNLHCGGNMDFVSIDPGDEILQAKSNFRGIAFGGRVSQQISARKYIDFSFDAYQNWINLDVPSSSFGFGGGSGFDFLSTSLGIQHKFKLMGDRMTIAPNIGFQLSHVGRSGKYAYFKQETLSGDLEVEYEIPLREDIWVPMAYAGINLAWHFKGNLALEAQGLYRQGFNELWDDSIEYRLDGAAPQVFSFSSKGSQVAIYLGMTYSFSFAGS